MVVAPPRPPLALAAGTRSWAALGAAGAAPRSSAAAAAVAAALGIGGADAAGSAPALAAAVPQMAGADLLLSAQVSGAALRTLGIVLADARARAGPLAGMPTPPQLHALQPGELVRLLAGLAGAGDDADYAARALAAAAMSELVGALNDMAAAAAAADAAAQPQAALAASAAALLDALGPLISGALMPVVGRTAPGFRGKALVKAVLGVLASIAEGPAVARAEWAGAWAAVGGTFWLSRCVCLWSDVMLVILS